MNGHGPPRTASTALGSPQASYVGRRSDSRIGRQSPLPPKPFNRQPSISTRRTRHPPEYSRPPDTTRCTPPSHAPAHPAAPRQISISLQFRGIAEIFGSQSQYLAAKVRFREFVRFPARHRRRATVRNRWNSANFSIHSSHPTCRQISISRPTRSSS